MGEFSRIKIVVTKYKRIGPTIDKNLLAIVNNNNNTIAMGN
jgi:hypothetical protein